MPLFKRRSPGWLSIRHDLTFTYSKKHHIQEILQRPLGHFRLLRNLCGAAIFILLCKCFLRSRKTTVVLHPCKEEARNPLSRYETALPRPDMLSPPDKV